MVATVSLRNVVKRYEQTTVVHGVNIDIHPGEFMVLVGPSGCGKSTTLRMVAGLEEISGGEILIDGKVVNNLAPKNRDVAMVFQNYALYPHLSVRDNISFGLRLNGVPRDVVAREVQAAASMLGLESLLDRKPSDLSGGQRQRVAMGRAIVRDPKVFLFDEPLSNLDAKLRTQMRTEIKRLHARLGTTVIYVTHDQVEAMTLADRIVVMRDGYIEQIGSPMELFNQPVNTFVAGFIGAPPMNLVEATTSGGLGLTFDDGQGIDLMAKKGAAFEPGRAVIMGVRAEDITLAPTGTRSATLTGIVDIAEPLGSETLLHVKVGSQILVVRITGRQRVETGSSVTLHMDLEQVHLFDAHTSVSVY